MAKKKTDLKLIKKKKVFKKINKPAKGVGSKPHLNLGEIEWIKALVATESIQETARQTGRSTDTVRRIKAMNEDEISQYRIQKKKEFVARCHEKMWMLLNQVTEGKCAFATVNQVTTAMGTIYDKAALASGDVTDRVEVKKDESEMANLTIEDLETLRKLKTKASRVEDV